MPKTVSLAAPRPHRIRSRIGVGLAGGFYPAPHRYQLYLTEGCPRSLRISVTLELLGLHDSVATTLLTLPAETPDAFAALRGAYEATWHHYDGPLTAPALCDRWSGRIVSNHTPDILRDLAGLPVCQNDARLPRLNPPALTADIDALRELLDRDVTPTAPPLARTTALQSLDRQLAPRAYALGDELTAADVDLWVALTRFDPTESLAPFGRLRDYVRRLDAHPAFHGKVR
ncbi:glutathione S-transferase C-terminal domain-containing protein [Streptomyces sp. RLB1-33]|uniref:glutathione S-transferase C-terminal domain-containing protein n=1 Tax=Streptomyces mirabilis TaxID=68239 RepID=UPI00143E3034|nr:MULTISPECIES: glutathione S-transferase C-terminal domain-containing protein [Streptomyces]QIY74741.1 cell envelope biogenesis protein OmpA [Streptomyces sp. RLB1-33]QUW78096.1 glutathione S-transferase C-terminal domain-containing protein [Streptomyces mirabilis]